MKILKLRFENLNSLYGEWVIDFTSPEYVSNGIFALTGPTGSGKSTILDAICLALYGATPRLGKITKSGNEIMSRQTGECYAEVTFESQAGRFCCHWSQRRARGKAEGNLLDSKHDIADVVSGQILESKKRDVARVVEEKTGMDFEQFTRSILLAQGGFDTFLKADVEQKSKILEQITGTAIYTEISRRVHEKQRDEREKLNVLQAETSGIVILTNEQAVDVKKELAEKQKMETEHAKRAMEIGKAISWLTGIDGLKLEINSLSHETEKLNAAFELFKPERKRLGRAQKAAQLDGIHATLTSTRKQQDEDLKILEGEEGKLPGAESSAAQKEELLKKAEQETCRARKEQKKLAPLIQKIRTLDQQLLDRKKLIDSGEGDCRKAADQIAGDKKKLGQVESDIDADQKRLDLVLDYLKTNARDEFLVSDLAGIEEQINNLSAVWKDISGKRGELARTEKQLQLDGKALALQKGKLSICRQELENTRQQLLLKKKELSDLLGAKLLREYRTKQETLLRDMAFLRKIADLESERTRLEDGKPCPLCGSETHPYAEGNVPLMDETEKKIKDLDGLILKAERFESDIKTLEASENEALKKVTSIEKIEAESLNKTNALEKTLTDITGELAKNNDRHGALKKSALNKLKPLGIQEIPESDAASILTSLKERLNVWKKNRQKREALEKEISEKGSEVKRVGAVIETQSRILNERQTALANLEREYGGQTRERSELFGTRSPDIEETRLDEAVSHGEKTEKSVQSARDEARKLLHSARVNITLLKERIDKRVPLLQTLESQFSGNLLSAGFADEKIFIASRLTLKEREQLQLLAKELDEKHGDLKARKRDRASRLALEIDKKVTDSKLEELAPLSKEIEEALKELQDHIAGLRHKLIDDQAAREKIKEKQALIDAQKNECSHWEKLHALIGSADGKKYRNFAQGLTFELMVSHANRQLQKMTDRYLLIRDDGQPLELNVVDNYQAGEIRSTRNLSGGESFIVSLTLALGLSKMASRKVRVDSLFLDEGFGTLDEDALETSLESLAGLQQDGKLIGIISHVPALRERISTQINIIPGSGGRSIVTGPGCS